MGLGDEKTKGRKSRGPLTNTFLTFVWKFDLSEVVRPVQPVIVWQDVHLIEVVDLQLVVSQIDTGRFQLFLLRLLYKSFKIFKKPGQMLRKWKIGFAGMQIL